MSNDDADREYDFYPEDFEGDDTPTARELDLAPVLIGACIGLGGLLFLIEPVISPVSVVGIDVRPMTLSAIALSAGLLGGGLLYAVRRRRMLAVAYGVGGVGWALVVFGHLLATETLLWTGIAVLVVGSVGLVAGVVRR